MLHNTKNENTTYNNVKTIRKLHSSYIFTIGWYWLCGLDADGLELCGDGFIISIITIIKLEKAKDSCDLLLNSISCP